MIHQLKRSQRQNLFIDRAEREQLYGGAKRGGKSFALCIKAIELSVEFPGNRGGLFRKEFTDMRDSLLVTFLRVCPPKLILSHNQTSHTIILRTPKEPSVIIYGGLGGADEIESAKGKEFGWVAIDEPSEVDPGVVRMIAAQLCWVLPDGTLPPYMMMYGSNPEPGWIEEKFRYLIEQTSEHHPLATDGNRCFVRALPTDNPYLPPNWLVDMEISDFPDEWKKKYLKGSWEVSEGQVYKEFDRAIHILPTIPNDDYLASLKLVASIDHATTGVTCMVIDGVDPDGNVVALAEYYQRNKTIAEHAAGMKVLMDEWVARCHKTREVQYGFDNGMYPATRAFEYILADPATQQKTMQNQTELWSVADEYRRNGIPFQFAWNAVEAGVSLFSQYLHVNPLHIHPLTNQRPSPKFFIVGPRNENGIREIIGWRKTIGENGKPHYSGADHWLDNQRYIVMSRPEPPRITTNDVQKVDTFSRLMMNDMARFDRKFRPQGEETNQWFGGGSGRSNAWFNRPQ